jgi:hypothetical protein
MIKLLFNARKIEKTMALAAGILGVFFLAAPGISGSINKGAGTTGFPFLKLGVGAKAVAMGGAFTAVADDPAALYYNPAGTINMENKRFLADYHNYVLDIQSGFLAATMPVMEKRRLGLFIDYLNFGDFIETDEFGNITGDFSGGDFLIGANFASPVYQSLTAGVNVKFISESAAGYSAEAFAADIGFYYRFGDSLTSVGMAVHNLGFVASGFSSGSNDEHKDDLPLNVRAGVAHSLRELPLLAALDLVFPNDNDIYINAGLEMYELQPLYLRLGYSSFGENYKTESNDSFFGGFSFGFGLDYKDFHIAYAFVPYLDLGTSHRVTITGGI